MREEDLRQLRGQVAHAQQALGHARVHGVRAEVQLLLLDGGLHRDSVHDVLLGPVFDADEAQTQADVLALDHPLRVGTAVHDVDFGDDADGPDALGVDLSRHLQPVGGGHIGVGGEDAEDDGPGVGHIPAGHGTGDLLDVVGLVRARHGDSGDTWQVDQGEIGAGVRVHGEHDWLVNDVLTSSADLISEKIDCLFNFLKVSEFLIWHLFKLGPWLNILR